MRLGVSHTHTPIYTQASGERTLHACIERKNPRGLMRTNPVHVGLGFTRNRTGQLATVFLYRYGGVEMTMWFSRATRGYTASKSLIRFCIWV